MENPRTTARDMTTMTACPPSKAGVDRNLTPRSKSALARPLLGPPGLDYLLAAVRRRGSSGHHHFLALHREE